MAGVDWAALRDRLERHDQGHVLRFLGELSETQKRDLYADISEVDLGKVSEYFQVRAVRLVADLCLQFSVTVENCLVSHSAVI